MLNEENEEDDDSDVLLVKHGKVKGSTPCFLTLMTRGEVEFAQDRCQSMKRIYGHVPSFILAAPPPLLLSNWQFNTC